MKNKKIKIGILGCGYECDELIDCVLPPWFNFSKDSDDDFVFSFVYGQFTEYIDIKGKNEVSTPTWYNRYKNKINYFFTPQPMLEKDMRNTALTPLLEEGCDIIILLDLQDEIYSRENIKNIINFIKKDSLTAWFSFSYKNYVFSDTTYLADPFTPPRAFRVKSGSYKLHSFYFDNEVRYVGTITRDFKDFKSMSNKNIPKSVSWITHRTWPSNIRGRQKVEYQQKHFGPQYCSFRWNDIENKLEFNPDYFTMLGKPIPEVLTD